MYIVCITIYICILWWVKCMYCNMYLYIRCHDAHKHSFPIYSDCLFLFSCHIPVPFFSVGRPSCRLPCSIQASLHHYPGRGAATVLYVACNWTWEQLVSAPKTSQEKYIGRLLLLHALPSVSFIPANAKRSVCFLSACDWSFIIRQSVNYYPCIRISTDLCSFNAFSRLLSNV